MEPRSIEIVAAQPGFFIVYDYEDEKNVELGEPVIAWRIETYQKKASNELFSSCFPLTVDGECCSNCIGIQNPDMTVTVFDESTYCSLTELREKRYPKK